MLQSKPRDTETYNWSLEVSHTKKNIVTIYNANKEYKDFLKESLNFLKGKTENNIKMKEMYKKISNTSNQRGTPLIIVALLTVEIISKISLIKKMMKAFLNFFNSRAFSSTTCVDDVISFSI